MVLLSDIPPKKLQNILMRIAENQKLKSRLWIGVGLIALFVALLYFAMQRHVAPDVTFTTIEGKNIYLADMRGKIVLINFWATSCSVCVSEMPELIKTYQAYQPKGLEVIAVAMSYDPPSHVGNYTKSMKLPFPVMHDGFNEIAPQFEDVEQTPTTFLLDEKGRIIQRIVGIIDFKALHTLLDERLAANLKT